MSQQLVLSINNTADNFRWCWLNHGHPQDSASGDLEALRTALGGITQQVWLLLPGVKVVTRELEYTDKEKKHLRNLLPYQLEDAVVGDIDELHFALGTAMNGKVTLSYTDKNWLREVFKQLTSIGLEINRCWSAPTLLPLHVPALEDVALLIETTEAAENVDADADIVNTIEEATLEQLEKPASATWVVALQEGVVNLRFGPQQGFTLPKGHFPAALDMLLNAQGLADNMPNLFLRANSEAELVTLVSLLPANFAARVSAKMVVNEWQLDFNGDAIDLCQAEFSQRLPLERWLKLWRSVGIFALVTLAVYIGVLMFHIFKLNKENLAIRQQTETVFRTAVPHGPSDDPEKKLRLKLADMQPKNQSGSVVTLLAAVLPLIANHPDVSVKVISYSADTGDMNVNVQAQGFNSIDGLQKSIQAQGFKAELLSSNAQGNVNTARLKISK